MKSLTKRILTEMALDLGDAPDWIDPEKKRKITQGEHPYADNPAFPTEKPTRRPGAPYKDDPNRADPTRTYSELVASHVYPEIVRKVQHYTGRNPRQMNPQQLTMEMMRAMQQAVQAEAPHRRELEQAAVEVVLSLPEFRDAREAVEAGDLKLEAHLLDPQEMMQQMQRRIKGAAPEEEDEPEGEQMQVEPGEESEEERAELGLDVPEIAIEYDAEAKKRRFINLLIQGCLPESAFVLTRQGYTQLKEFTSGEVWTGNAWTEGVKIPMGRDRLVEVTLCNGYTFLTDSRHKVLCCTGAWPEWISVLKATGTVLAESAYPETSGLEIEDDEYWYWIGRYYGDGHISYWRRKGAARRRTTDPLCPEGNNSRANVHWCFGPDELFDVNFAKKYWEGRGIKVCVRPQYRNGKIKNYDVYLSSAALIRQWRSYGVEPNQRAAEKTLTALAFRLSKSRREALYRGYYSADGTKKRQSAITSVSRPLLNGFLLLGRSIGKCLHIKGPYFNGENRPFYRLAESREYAEHKLRIASVRILEAEQEMYTISVKDEKHSFEAEGVIAQNSAINKNYAYHQIADQLRAIDPDILTTYGKLMSIGELMYWVAPEDLFNRMQGSGAGGGGMEEIVPEEDDTYTIRARAMVFPVLIQELAKGLYEFLSFVEDDPADVRKHAYNRGDTLKGEQWDTMKGPGVWRHLNHLVNQADAGELLGKIYRHLVTRPTGEFNELMQEILRETPRGRQYIQQLVNNIRAEEKNRREESVAYRFIRTSD